MESAAIDDENECITVVIALCIKATRVRRVDEDSLATETDEDTDEGEVVDEKGAGDGISAESEDSSLTGGDTDGDAF